MTPLLTIASSRVITNLHSGGGYTNTLAQIESVCMLKLDSIRAKVFVRPPPLCKLVINNS